jgi:hypothetical protein
MITRIAIKPQVTEKEIRFIQDLIDNNSSWGRTRLSVEICKIWNWSDESGNPKDISCRDMLRRMDARGQIRLPARFGGRKVKPRGPDRIEYRLHETAPIECGLKDILPIRISIVAARTSDSDDYKSLIAQYHYLGFDMTVGENIKYLVHSCQDQLLACLLFGSSAWSSAPRDQYIGWNRAARKANLICTTNNTRFLILPWVRVPHLASHILGHICRRIGTDWQQKYGHPLYLLETFVEQERFKGTCYRAANWIHIGETTGRSRNDRYKNLQVPVKDIYLYPLCRDFRKKLDHVDSD